MTLVNRTIELIDEAEKTKQEHELIVDIDTYGRSVHLSTYDAEYLNAFLKLADEEGKTVKVEERNDLDYPFKAHFEKGGVKFFVLLDQDEKTQLEKLINEREAEGEINE